MTLSIRASTAETWNARRTPSRNYLSRPRPSKQASTLASARGARIAASEMATPGDALRAQAEVRLQHLRRKVAAHRKVKDYEGEEKALKELDALEAVMKYIDETSEQMTKVRVICSGLELAVAMRSPYSLLCETSFLELIERYLGVLLRELDGADAGEIQDDMRKLRSLRDELDELDAANSSVILTVALDDDDTGRQTTNFETEEILTPPPLQDLVDAAVNSRPLESGRRGTRRRRRSGEQSEKRQTRDGASRPSGKRLRARRPHARRPSARRPSARRGKRRRARPKATTSRRCSSSSGATRRCLWRKSFLRTRTGDNAGARQAHAD